MYRNLKSPLIGKQLSYPDFFIAINVKSQNLVCGKSGVEDEISHNFG